MQYNPPFGTTGDAGFIDGNPGAGQPGSIPPAAAMEFTQREIVACIQAAGLTPSNTDLRQLMQAVRGGALSFFGDVGIANTLHRQPEPELHHLLHRHDAHGAAGLRQHGRFDHQRQPARRQVHRQEGRDGADRR